MKDTCVKETMVSYVREKTPDYMYILSVRVVMYGKHVRESVVGYILYIQVVRGSWVMVAM